MADKLDQDDLKVLKYCGYKMEEGLLCLHPKLRWKPRRSGRGGKRLCSLLNRISILS